MLRQCSDFNRKFLLFTFILFFTTFAFSQNSKGKIRGYKVHSEKIEVHADTEEVSDSDSDVKVSFSEAKFSGITLKGALITVTPEIYVKGQSGTVDSLVFENIEINGNPVTIDEFTTSFAFNSREKITFSKPVRINIGAVSSIQTIIKELTDSEKKWNITGRVYVFGRFKRAFLTFKRVVPIEFSISITNPIQKN
ncbi:MAG: hypothetical protein ACK5NT_15390 [Pyrinomonadaceae bacterium]